MEIVLVTSGKNESVDNVKVVLFDSEYEAIAYCSKTTDNPKDKKYWKSAQVVTEGYEYELSRYELLP